jgi:integrase
MSRRRSEQPTDRWHKSRLGAGEQPCRGGDGCRGAQTAPTAEHGQGLRWMATWTEVTDGARQPRRKSFPGGQQGYDAALYFQTAKRKGLRDKTMPPGTVAREGVVTLAWYFASEFMPDTEGNRSGGSNDKVRTQFRTGIAPFFGDTDLADLQHMARQVRRWQECLRDGVAPAARAYTLGTIDTLFLLLAQICEQAIGDERTGMTRNPCKTEAARLDRAERGKRARVRRKAGFTTSGVAALYQADTSQPRAQRGSPPAWDRYRAVPLAAATTGGMRLSEVLGLGWTVPDDGSEYVSDIDWAGQLITMNYSLVRTGAIVHFSDGKSENAQRVMTATPLALSALRRHLEIIEPIEVTLPLEIKRGPGNTRGKPMSEWPRLTRRLIFSTSGRRGSQGDGSPVVVPAFQSAARFALYRAGLLPAREHESRSVRGTDGRYTANGGADPARRRVDQRYENPSGHGIHNNALRNYFQSLLEHRGVPLSVIQDEVGHERTRLADGTEPGDGFAAVTLGYIQPIPGSERERWRDKVRDIISAEFGPLLPELR